MRSNNISISGVHGVYYLETRAKSNFFSYIRSFVLFEKVRYIYVTVHVHRQATTKGKDGNEQSWSVVEL